MNTLGRKNKHTVAPRGSARGPKSTLAMLRLTGGATTGKITTKHARDQMSTAMARRRGPTIGEKIHPYNSRWSGRQKCADETAPHEDWSCEIGR